MYAISLLRYEGTFTIRWNPSPLHSPPPPLPVYIRASLNLMVLYGETRSGQGYKARYGNSILVENSSKPGTLRFPGRTAPVVFERGGSMPNYRREYLTRVAIVIRVYIPVTRCSLEKIFRRIVSKRYKKKKNVVFAKQISVRIRSPVGSSFRCETTKLINQFQGSINCQRMVSILKVVFVG